MVDVEKRVKVLADYAHTFGRIAICGGPRTGKTTLASMLSSKEPHKVIHTDDYIERCEWEDVPRIVNADCVAAEFFVLEGVQAARCLRGSKDGSVPGLNVDAVIWLDSLVMEVNPRQASMAAGVKTVFASWLAMNRGRVLVSSPDKI